LEVKGSQGNNNSLAVQIIFLEVAGSQENYFPWRLLASKKTFFFNGCNISLALWQIKCGRSFLGGQPSSKSSLSAGTAKETNFP